MGLQWVGGLFIYLFFIARAWNAIGFFSFSVMVREEKHSTYGTVIPSWRMLCAGELEAIQMQWSKQAYISQNNIEAANSCRISQTACLAATHSTRISRES